MTYTRVRTLVRMAVILVIFFVGLMALGSLGTYIAESNPVSVSDGTL